MTIAQVPKNTAKETIDWEMIEQYFPGSVDEEQRTKFTIFYAAARLFASKGYRGASVREIVEAAGVTKPTL